MISKFFSKFKGKETNTKPIQVVKSKQGKPVEKLKVAPERIGELGEYKINIQLDQLPKNWRYISDILIANQKSKTGYSQVDHVILSPYAFFVIETKNYTGTIYGSRDQERWSVNGRFPMLNPFRQNFGHVQALKAVVPNVKEHNIVSMISFTRRCTLKVDTKLRNIQSNDLIVYDTELSEFITRKINILRLQLKEPMFTDEMIQDMYRMLAEHNITDEKTRREHVGKIQEKIKKSDSKPPSKATCETCGKAVSEKVKLFCHSNSKRFNGRIYCFEHQKQ